MRRTGWRRLGPGETAPPPARRVATEASGRRRDRIKIVPHDQGWAALFEEQRLVLGGLPQPWLRASVEHVGSTAVPGLAAKPIIDMLAVIGRYEDFASALAHPDFSSFAAAVGIADDESNATGETATVTFYNQANTQLAVARVLLGRPVHVRFSLHNADRMLVSCTISPNDGGFYVTLGNGKFLPYLADGNAPAGAR
jgi:GrpB-like predicted nucleotidyltransferase (UPF0157 family)